MVIPDLYTKVDIYTYFGILTLEINEFAPKHGYS